MLKKHHIHLLSGLLGVVALIATVILNISSSTHAATWLLSGGNITWDNSNFIDANFWGGYPSTGDIIKALYGSGSEGSAYTRNWSGWNGTQCPLGSMNVLYTGNLPTNLSVNTIYVLTGAQAIVPSTRNLATCSAVISDYEYITTLYSNGQIVNDGILKADNKQYTIIDNIRINGTDNGSGGSHTGNAYGIYLVFSSNNSINNSQSYNNTSNGIYFNSYSNNNTINISQFYNNTFHGIYLNSSSNNTINNSQFYNNTSHGIYLNSSSNNTINNSQFYNNSNLGIRLASSSNNNSINNSQVYNNNQHGIRLASSSNNNSINNSQVYNNYNFGIYLDSSSNNSINNSQSYNNSDGIRLASSSNNNSINNSQAYNNSSNGIGLFSSSNNSINNSQAYNNFINGIYLDATSIDNIYYGKLALFSNGTNNLGGISGNLSTGYSSDPLVQSVGRTTGNLITTGTMSWDFVTNPFNMGDYLLSRSGSWSDIRGFKSLYSGTVTNRYSFGSGILLQTQPVILSGTTDLISSGSFDPTKYIGSDLIKITGELYGLPPYSTGTTTYTVSGYHTMGTRPTYNLFGDITTFWNNISAGINTTLNLTSGTGLKRIVIQLTEKIYFAKHFQRDIIVDTTAPSLAFNSGTVVESQNCTLIATGSDSESGLAPLAYSWSTNGTTRDARTATNTSGPFLYDEPTSLTLRVRVRDNAGYITTGSATCTRTNTVPANATLSSNGPVNEGSTITRTASATDTGTTLSYRWYSGSTCATFLLSGQSTLGITLYDPATLTRSVKIFDAQGSGTACLASTNTWNNLAPTAQSLSGSAIVGTPIGFTATGTDPALGGTPFSYQWFAGASCGGSVIATGATFTGNMSTLGTTVRSYKIFDVQGSGSNCAIATGSWNSVTPMGCLLAEDWNNQNFVNQDFWNLWPTDGNIICALYGSGLGSSTAYTRNRSGWDGTQCDIYTMSVTEVSNLPTALTPNTIYVLTGEQAIVPSTRYLANCSAVVSRHASGTILYSSNRIVSDGMLRTDNKQHTIIDNIRINGTNDGSGGSHTGNMYGIYFSSSSNNNTINNSQAYNNNDYGISFWSSSNNTINNSQAYNNNYGISFWSSSDNNTISSSQSKNNGCGIYLQSSSNNTINNSKLYNNSSQGIRFFGSFYNSINASHSYNNNIGIQLSSLSNNNSISNSQIYNNSNVGIYLSYSSKNSISNSQIYNNNLRGIDISSSSYNSISNSQIYNNNLGIEFGLSSNNVINNSQVYNNSPYGIYTDSAVTSYYGDLFLFANQTDIYGYLSGLSTGYASDTLVQFVGRTTGKLITIETMSWDFITNPLNTSSEYLLSWSDSWANIKGYKSSYLGTTTNTYSYGSGILLQAQPVIWSGTTNLINSGSFDPTKYIGSDVVKVTGELLGLPAMTSGLNFTVTGNSSTGVISRYSLFGDITTFGYNVLKGTSTGIILTNSDGTKRIVTQLFGTPYFATHFETDTLVDTTAPSQVTLISPSSGSSLTTGNISLVRSSAVDTGVGISGYYFEIVGTSYSGFVLTTGTDIVGIADGNYTRQVYAIDNIGNTGERSETRGFTIDTHFTTPVDCATRWNNDSFLTTGFWNQNPTSGNIICALYGSGVGDTTAYTTNWSGRDTTQCSGSDMTVIETGDLPVDLYENTIYVLTGEQSIVTNRRKFANCSAVVSRHAIGTTLYSTNTLLSKGIFFAENIQHIIIDSVDIDGRSNGIGGYHTGNEYGINMLNSSNISLYDIGVYNNKRGIIASMVLYFDIIDAKIYNNLYDGIAIQESSNNTTITNSQIYNNKQSGILYWNTNNNTLNNTQIYGNIDGIRYELGLNNTISNSQIYNNKNYGIFFAQLSSYTIFHTIGIYNNGTNNSNIFKQEYDYTDKYYGAITTNIFNELENLGFTAGSSADTGIAGLGRSTGEIVTGVLSRDYFTNPFSTNGTYLFSWSGSRADVRDEQTNYSGMITSGYSYGSKIFLQEQPVYYSGSTLMTGGTWDGTKYIGSDMTQLTGSLSGYFPALTNSTGVYTVEPLADTALGYTLWGNILGEGYDDSIGTTTGIFITTGDGQKNIITQIYSPFAVHFQRDTFLDQTPPSQVVLISPLSGSTVYTPDITLTRDIATDTGSGLSGYYFEIVGTEYSGFVTQTGIDIVGMADGTYTRQVYAIDNAGNTGERSSATLNNVWSFTVDNDTTAPSQVQLISPSSGTIFFTGINIEFLWAPAQDTGSGIDGYYVELYLPDDSTMTGIISATGVTIPFGLPEGDYQWHVYAIDIAGNTGERSETRGFTITPCGDGDVNGSEQCDGQIGCSSSCTREPVSCSIQTGLAYSGITTTITGTVNSGRTIVSGFNFGLPNYPYSIGLSGNYSTGHTYNSGGIYQITMDVVHPGSGDITDSCTGSIEVQYCGDGDINGSEDCDGGIGCSSSCTLIPPTNTDCTLPWGGTIVSGASVTAYQSASVACGTSCVAQTRTCLSGTLSGTFTQQTCSVVSCGGGGGSTIIPRDDCTLPSNVACANAEGIDNSPSYYDNSCCGTTVSTGGTHGAASTCDVSNSPYSSEITDAFSWAYGINITDKCPITRARLDSKITRIEAAKMMSMFTIQIIGLTPNTSKKGCDKFSDLGSVSDEMKFFAKTACQLDIMGLEPDGKTPKKKFDPKDLIDRAQFGTMLSRLVYGDVYNLSSREKKTIARYQKHLEALGKDDIIQKIPSPWTLENRSRVMIMLKRTQDQGLVEKYRLVAPAHNGAVALFDNVW